MNRVIKDTRSAATTKSTACLSCLVGILYNISQERMCWWLLANQLLLRNGPRKLPYSAK